MIEPTTLSLSGDRIRAVYEFHGDVTEAETEVPVPRRRLAEPLATETAETPAAAETPEPAEASSERSLFDGFEATEALAEATAEPAAAAAGPPPSEAAAAAKAEEQAQEKPVRGGIHHAPR